MIIFLHFVVIILFLFSSTLIFLFSIYFIFFFLSPLVVRSYQRSHAMKNPLASMRECLKWTQKTMVPMILHQLFASLPSSWFQTDVSCHMVYNAYSSFSYGKNLISIYIEILTYISCLYIVRLWYVRMSDVFGFVKNACGTGVHANMWFYII